MGILLVLQKQLFELQNIMTRFSWSRTRGSYNTKRDTSSEFLRQ